MFEYWAHEACLAPGRGLAAVPPAHARAARPPLVRARDRGRPRAERARARRDPRARPARLAPLRGPGRRRDVELEAGQADARGALDRGPARDRRPRGVPAPVRPARAGDPAGAARRAGAERGRVAARADAARRPRPRRAHRGRRRRALPAPGRRRRGCGRTSTRWSPRGSCGGSRSTTAARRCSSRPTPRSTAEPSGAVLLSPFDNLLWDRDFARRVLGFDHLIEVYKPQPERVYGYYVLPLLRGDRIVGRADLKSDRKAGTLRVQALPPRAGRAPLRRARRGARPRPRAPRLAARTRYHRSARHGLRDARHPRGPGARSGDRRGHHADLPDLDVRAGGGRRAQGLRLLARREPDAHRTRDVPRLARGRRARARLLLRDSARRRRSCTSSTRASGSC